MQYLTNWKQLLVKTSEDGNITHGNAPTELEHRPVPVGTLFDSTTIEGSWINQANMTADFEKFNRIVNNVSLAMPHSGVYGAAINPRNRILQPQDIDVCFPCPKLPRSY